MFFLPVRGGWFNMKMPSYQYTKCHCRYKIVIRSSYLHKWDFLHRWDILCGIRAQVISNLLQSYNTGVSCSRPGIWRTIYVWDQSNMIKHVWSAHSELMTPSLPTSCGGIVSSCDLPIIGSSGIILGMGSANERRCYIVALSLIGCVHTQNDPWSWWNSIM